MRIQFSRHAKRRARLYKLPESLIEQALLGAKLIEGENTILTNMPGIIYPVKIVIVLENQTATIITNYPMKKAHHNESSL